MRSVVSNVSVVSILTFHFTSMRIPNICICVLDPITNAQSPHRNNRIDFFSIYLAANINYYPTLKKTTRSSVNPIYWSIWMKQHKRNGNNTPINMHHIYHWYPISDRCGFKKCKYQMRNGWMRIVNCKFSTVYSGLKSFE